MAKRRIHVVRLEPGLVAIGRDEANHLMRVLRLKAGAEIELFDGLGRSAQGVLVETESGVAARVEVVVDGVVSASHLTIASAVPKGERADWMIEKLSELGVDQFVPLRTARSVVHPEGVGKLARWRRIAQQAARQSGRVGVMEIAVLTELGAVLKSAKDGGGGVLCCSTAPGASPISAVLASQSAGRRCVLIGPEGGWDERELEEMNGAGAVFVALTETVLRVETAAVAAACCVLCDSGSPQRRKER